MNDGPSLASRRTHLPRRSQLPSLANGTGSRAASHTGSNAASHTEWIALLGIATAAVAFRLVRLGALSFAGDEETTALATLALLDGWPPELPGGLVYLRGLVFTVLEGAAVAIAGPSEASLRLVPVLAAGPRVVGAWWLARPFLGGPAALGVAGLLALAPLDVEMSRDARMYSLFGTFDVLFLAGVVHLVRTGSGTVWAALTGALAVLSHALAAFHAPLPLLATLAPGIRLRRALALAVVAAVVGGAYQLERELMRMSYADIDHVDVETGGSGRRRPLSDHFERMQTLRESPVSAALAGAPALASAGLTLFGLARLRRPVARLAAAATGIAWIAALPVFGAVGLIATLMLEALPLAALRDSARALLAAGVVATGGFTAAALADGSLEAGARLLLGFPAPNWIDFGRAAPGLFVLAVAGVCIAVDRAAHAEQPGTWLVLVAAAMAPALVGGLVWRTEALRYQFHALVPLLVLALLAAWTLTSVAVRRRGPALALALVLTAVAVRPDQALRAVLREHGPVSEPFAILNVAPDHRGAGSFLRAHAAEDEWIAAEDPLQQRYYAGRTDVWLRRLDDAAAYLQVDPQGGAPRDVYTGSRHAHDLDALRALAVAHEKSVVWLVTSGEVEAEPKFYRTDETHQTLGSWRTSAWFEGADGMTRVYRLEHGQPSRPPDGGSERAPTEDPGA